MEEIILSEKSKKIIKEALGVESLEDCIDIDYKEDSDIIEEPLK